MKDRWRPGSGYRRPDYVKGGCRKLSREAVSETGRSRRTVRGGQCWIRRGVKKVELWFDIRSGTTTHVTPQLSPDVVRP